MKNSKILYGVPKVAYGTYGCTPFPLSVKACSEYLGRPISYAKAMAESGAAFRLAWNTAAWDGGNVDAHLTFDDSGKVYVCGLRSMGCNFNTLGRTAETSKEEFMDFICREIDEGNPVIALGIIGPPEAGIVAGYRDGGQTLLGWNVFQDYPENQAAVQYEENGYYVTDAWWENPDTQGLFATGGADAEPFGVLEVLENAIEALEGRMCGSYAKGICAYGAWKSALLRDAEFPKDAVMPILVERMMCQGDAMDCLSDGRHNAAVYLRELESRFPVWTDLLEAAAKEFDGVVARVWEMVNLLGGWERGEAQMRRLAEPEVRRKLAGLIDQMQRHDERALECMRKVVEVAV